ncbi:glycolate oxidase iron-sulfur subunit [Tistlia consotensis]|uniref:Glycolate oxidase iron-sulfur subunit n=1 Tax=Tistlia consotensis USBA 355 TaxID=560819 RepID=A0A1Y6B5V2_9PROT|nr:glycolate oxidase subunit GlcF [Tistlia consotensis]SME91441.1 glycolate oxidase iron-sulfur subunit [Tistlia consotensis USBA 355]SNR27371.1 glycolate oxidase iron-sulfur subunit [Tistlia consotensis]
MQTSFTLAQLADPEVAEANDILRACVHCGFCTATCPTYVLLGDELDSPRGRIYLIKDMLENDRTPSVRTVTHIDRCLSCLSCMTTCPSGVHYMHLVDQARARIEERYERPAADRLLRALLAWLLPRPGAFRLALLAAWFARPFAGLAGGLFGGRLKAMLTLAPARLPSPSPVDRPQVFPAEGPRRMRVALLAGCAQQVLAPEINEATIRLLTRHGVEVVIARGAGCCGALTHHMGREAPALASARANVDAWSRELEGEGLDAVVINASGCGTTVKDYGHMLRLEPAHADKAVRISALTRDVTELLDELGALQVRRQTGQAIAYHSACSMQHGQQIRRQPKALLQAAGFAVREPLEGHLCCGSAGVYNLLQPAIAGRLRDRKAGNLERTGALAIATGNIGCMTQIAGGTGLPVVHTVGLLDWATGGPLPKALEGEPAFAATAGGETPAQAAQ